MDAIPVYQVIANDGTKVPFATHMALVLHDSTDTDTQGVLARLEPAVNDLYACTPGDIHEALTGALLHVAAEYDLADEMMDLALCSRAKAAGQADDDGDDADFSCMRSSAAA